MSSNNFKRWCGQVGEELVKDGRFEPLEGDGEGSGYGSDYFAVCFWKRRAVDDVKDEPAFCADFYARQSDGTGDGAGWRLAQTCEFCLCFMDAGGASFIGSTLVLLADLLSRGGDTVSVGGDFPESTYDLVRGRCGAGIHRLYADRYLRAWIDASEEAAPLLFMALGGVREAHGVAFSESFARDCLASDRTCLSQAVYLFYCLECVLDLIAGR